MGLMVVKLLVKVVVFGVALTLVCRRDPGVKVTPRSALPVVAMIFAVLNTLLYGILATGLNLVTLFAFFFLVPFAVNAILLLVTDRFVKPFKIESITALVRASFVMTIAHIALRLIENLLHI
jgi:putative membrane protein